MGDPIMGRMRKHEGRQAGPVQTAQLKTIRGSTLTPGEAPYSRGRKSESTGSKAK